MRKLLWLGLLVSQLGLSAAVSYSGQVNLSPAKPDQFAPPLPVGVSYANPYAIIEQRVGSSLVLGNSGGSSLVGASVISIKPEVWVTNTGSSNVSYAFSPPSLGPGIRLVVPGQTARFGGSLTLPMSWVFHAPSIYPAYGNSLQVGTQTYSINVTVLMNDGSYIYPTKATLTVAPKSLPQSQVSGWH